MLKKLQTKHISLMVGAGLSAFLAGAMFSAPEIGKSVGQWLQQLTNSQAGRLSDAEKISSAVLPLVLQSPQERATKLESLTKSSSSLDRNRARYLLASDLIKGKQAQEALQLLRGLENDYRALAPYILLKQAQAQQMLGEEAKASDLRQAVLKKYPQEAATGKALYLIGAKQYQDRAIAEFPSHPLTWEIIRQRLQNNPNQPELLLILAKHAYDQPGIVGFLNRLIQEPTLKPEDWKIIAKGYWLNRQFGKASTAYGKAPRTAKNLYRQGRGLQISREREKAIAVYNQLVESFPEASQTGRALLNLAQLTKTRKEAIPYLDQVISKYPEQAGKALVKKAQIFRALNNKQAEAEALQLLLDKHGGTKEAAEYRWKTAKAKAKAKDYKAAWKWAKPVTTNNPNSILAPRAGFWAGKWATKLGNQAEAKQIYEYVVSNFPQSYYAWRSAGILGLNVGNFNNVRQMNPAIIELQRPLPTAGSDTFKELYLLGQDWDAWLQWETEFRNSIEPTVAEEFTEGLVKFARGKHLKGISTIAKLEDRTTPEEQAEYQTLSKNIIYWQARYPFPYFDLIQSWSGKRQLNPLLVTALMRQESRFEPKIKSTAKATGLMQVLPSTAKWIAEKEKLDKTPNLEDPDGNILLGTWYLDHTHKQYGDNSLLAIASYNAGPGNVAKWLKTLPTKDTDEFVEAIPFDETKNYVRQVFGNYWNYLRLYNPEISQIVAQYSQKQPQLSSKIPETQNPKSPI
ncbi:transglycosylase SLT domain-containing protein [Calothrix rhizosoleniae]|uniref:transglycosylase SLT domain-containing protein n=1 Tax=Calothrix rhizosoleniae TaxID=888997 RepID=UPI000B49AB54|nr:transglycosylase SLT domain-containing protein [Calothrix rhizosoleniae]